ncbi:MAG: hypothetical protein ACLFUB_18825 [Cyclobacteriaceae bacterium]
MINLLKIVSLAGLLLTIVPSVLYFYGHISFELQKMLMLAGTLAWFASAPFWMNRKAKV